MYIKKSQKYNDDKPVHLLAAEWETSIAFPANTNKQVICMKIGEVAINGELSESSNKSQLIASKAAGSLSAYFSNSF